MQVISTRTINTRAVGRGAALQHLPATFPAKAAPSQPPTHSKKKPRLSSGRYQRTGTHLLTSNQQPGLPAEPGTLARGRGTAHLLFILGVVSITARILVLLPVFAMLAGGQEDNILTVMDVI